MPMSTGARALYVTLVVVVCVVFFFERSHKKAQADLPSPAPPGAYRQRLVAVGDLHGGELASALQS